MAAFVIVAVCLTGRRLACWMSLHHWAHDLTSAMTVMRASWERLSGHDGDGEHPGRPVNWQVELASMRAAPVVLHEGEVRNRACLF